MTNHRTDAPIFAACKAATSPIPPGGEMTTNFPSAAIRRFVRERETTVCDGRNALVVPNANTRRVAAIRRFAMFAKGKD